MLHDFFGQGVNVRGVLLHPSSPDREKPGAASSTQWAQLFTDSEEEVNTCLSLRSEFATKNMYAPSRPSFFLFFLPPLYPLPRRTRLTCSTIMRPPPAPVGWSTPETQSSFFFNHLSASASPPSAHLDDVLVRPGADQFRPEPNSLARNLYVLGIPVDMTQSVHILARCRPAERIGTNSRLSLSSMEWSSIPPCCPSWTGRGDEEVSSSCPPIKKRERRWTT
jgi:hypothetical protein